MNTPNRYGNEYETPLDQLELKPPVPGGTPYFIMRFSVCSPLSRHQKRTEKGYSPTVVDFFSRLLFSVNEELRA